ncbi:hypothetical protein CLOM_g7620, partial [Closterium sp. NIES-68]
MAMLSSTRLLAQSSDHRTDGSPAFSVSHYRHRFDTFLLVLSLSLLVTASLAQNTGECAEIRTESSGSGSRTCAASAEAPAEGSEAYSNLETSENGTDAYSGESADGRGYRKIGSVEHDVAGSERAMVEDMLTWMGLDWTRDSEGSEYGIIVGGSIEVDFSTRSVHEATTDDVTRDVTGHGSSGSPEGGAGAWKPNDTRADIGFKAARRLAEGEVLLKVPRRFHIVANWIALNESERHLLPYDMPLPVPHGWDTYTVLAAWLLRERAKGALSPWSRFLRSLPAYVPLPALFPSGLIEEFEYQPIVDQ